MKIIDHKDAINRRLYNCKDGDLSRLLLNRTVLISLLGMNSQANSESPLKRTEDCGNLSSSPLERTYAIRLGIHSEAGWIHSAKICVYTVAFIKSGLGWGNSITCVYTVAFLRKS
jgi:hypothetical protein